MDVTGFLDSAQERVNLWFKEEQVSSFTANYEFLVIGALALLIGIMLGFFIRRKSNITPFLEAVDHSQEVVEHSSVVFLQLLLVESKLVFERYQADVAVFLNVPIEDLACIDCSLNTADLLIYNTGIKDLKALKHSALRQQIVKTNTQFKLALSRVEQCQRLHLEYMDLTKVAAVSQKPIDDNATAKSRLKLHKQLQTFEREHQQVTIQMQQMLAMIRADRKNN